MSFFCCEKVVQSFFSTGNQWNSKNKFRRLFTDQNWHKKDSYQLSKYRSRGVAAIIRGLEMSNFSTLMSSDTTAKIGYVSIIDETKALVTSLFLQLDWPQNLS